MISSKNIFFACWCWPQKWIDRIFLAMTSLIPTAMIFGQGYADAMLTLIGIAFLVRSAITRYWAWARESWFLLAMLLWVWLIFISFFAVIDFNASISRALLWIRFVVFIAALKEWILNDQKYRRTAALFIAACIFITIISLWKQFIFGDTLHGISSSDSGRLSGPFKDWIAGTFLAKVIMPVLGIATAAIIAMIDKRSIRIGLIYLLAIALLVSVLITGERIAFLSLALSVVIFFASLKNLRRGLFIPIALGITLGSAALSLSPSIKSRMIDDTIFQLASFSDSHYGMIFSNAASMIEDYPLTGVGLKNYRQVCRQEGYRWFKNDPANCGLHPHNPYLEWAAESGIPGLLLFIVLMALMIVRMIKAHRNITVDNYPFALGALLSLIPFLWPLMSSMSLFTNWNAIMFWYALAFAFSFTQSVSTVNLDSAISPRKTKYSKKNYMVT
ncbi:O-antigen ligase family protein [Methylotuvimicrobium sp.]|uniref:O-antigen ligase family protein n=1 Tax=Methylotuvimicrobium sp. TaxID=2822413 RepID=UPI003D65904B